MSDDTTTPPSRLPALSPISCVRERDRRDLDQRLVEWGVDVVELDGSNIADEETFRDAVGSQLPMPGDLTPGNWSALTDCLHQLFIDRGAPRAALIWTHPEVLIGGDLQGFLTATNVLSGLVSTLYRVDQIEMHVFLVGPGAGYRALDDIVD
ncbi:MAG: barstar family protein [Acidimicrobiia bacterium]